MTPEIHPMDPALEQAMSDIRDEAIDDAVIEAAAGRVWARIVEAQDEEVAAGDEAPHIRNCADFQGLIPDYRAGRLPDHAGHGSPPRHSGLNPVRARPCPVEPLCWSLTN